MKFTLKTLQRDTFEVDIDENLTVSDLKKKIEEEKGAGYAAPNLKLIYAGKILSDEKAMKEYDISAFIVVMVSKPKAAPTQTEGTSSSTAAATTPAATPAQPTPTPPAATTTAPTPAPAPAPAAVPAAVPAGGDSMMVQGPEYENAVAEIISMGFERSQVERAMAASFMNPNRAVDYLFNPSLMPAAAPPQQAAPGGDAPPPAAVVPPPASGEAPAAPGGGLANLDFLRNQPQISHLRQMISQNPAVLQNVLEELAQSNPDLLQAIQANPQQFINLLNEGGGGAGGQGGVPQVPGAGGQPGAPQPPTVQITPAEKEAIDRIKALGFPEHLVVQAYFACEKNENLAAEFLFSENFQDDNQ